jgi:hypothetical protein
MKGASIAELDGGDGVLEQVEYGCDRASSAGIELVPFPGGVAQQERRLDDQFSIDPISARPVAVAAGGCRCLGEGTGRRGRPGPGG